MTPRGDLQAPDLYIPLMSFITFVLLIGWMAQTKDAKIDVGTLIGVNYSKCLFIWTLEAIIQKGVFYFCGIANIPFLEILSYTGYKFLPLTLVMTTEIAFGYFPSYCVMAVMWACFSYFFFMTMRRFAHANTLADHMKEFSLNRKTFMLINCGV